MLGLFRSNLAIFVQLYLQEFSKKAKLEWWKQFGFQAAAYGLTLIKSQPLKSNELRNYALE